MGSWLSRAVQVGVLQTAACSLSRARRCQNTLPLSVNVMPVDVDERHNSETTVGGVTAPVQPVRPPTTWRRLREAGN